MAACLMERSAKRCRSGFKRGRKFFLDSRKSKPFDSAMRVLSAPCRLQLHSKLASKIEGTLMRLSHPVIPAHLYSGRGGFVPFWF